jgi:hypothetical protein
MSPVDTRRRQLCLTIGGVLTAGLAGCSGDGDDDSAGDDDSTDNDGTTADGSASDDASTDGDSTGDDGTADEDSEDDGGTNDDGDDSATNDDGNDSSDDGQSGELDRREANVVGVEYESDAEDYTFDVTLHHDDDGEDGYANWWQVERLDGTQLGRRDLLHAHSRQPFTRSETVTVPDAVSCVVVRGHDQTHGYGGQAMLVTLDSGETRAVEQGSEATAVEEGDCP